MKKSLLIGSLLALVSLACTSSHEKSSDLELSQHELELEKTAILDESNILLGNIESFDFINQDEFILATSAGTIATYNTLGQNTKSFSHIGNGPFEFIHPSIIRANNNRIFIWCSALMKLVVYNLDGQPLDEYTNFSIAVSDFAIEGNMVYFYMSGGGLYSLIEQYDLSKRKTIQFHGKESGEDEVMALNACSGGLLVNEGKLLYMGAGSLTVQSVKADLKENHALTDDFFKTRILEGNELMAFRSDTRALLDYIYNNSLVFGVYPIGTNYLIKTEIGTLEFDKFTDLDTWKTEDRFEKYFLLDQELSLISSYKRPYNPQQNSCLYRSNGETVFSISTIEKSGQDDFQYQLNRFQLIQQ